MPLMIVIEDGSGVANANSYCTLQAVRDYNAQRGVMLPADDDALTGQLTAAMDFIEAYEPRWQGDRALPLTQDLSWPRQNVWLYGNPFPVNAIPRALVSALSYLTGVAGTVDLYAVQDTRAITKEVIGPLETDYSVTAGASVKPIIPQLDALLAPLLNFNGATLRTVRV